MQDYNRFFRLMTSGLEPHPWQERLAGEAVCINRLIRIPTGFGKTLGLFGAWIWNRVVNKREDWPRRLLWCLPMRVLVEQTEFEIRKALNALGFRQGSEGERSNIGVYTLMGGVDTGEWHLYPERCAVLIGTQDMLLSRALNRGYASPRARWPMEFGLLNQDCLWVLDEVQLMDVGLATSAQLQAFRMEDESAKRCPRPCRSWWASATLQRDWLSKSPETSPWKEELSQVQIAPNERRGRLWDDVQKTFQLQPFSSIKDTARLVSESQLQRGGTTLVVVNTVDRAQGLFEELTKDRRMQKRGTDIRLVHSRFRPHERRRWREEFLNRQACAEGADRVIIATQVVEAGVDISAGTLITELASWASLVQRFGRCARWGGEAQVVVLDILNGVDEKGRAKAARPYRPEELEASREALRCLESQGLSPRELECFEEITEKGLRDRLYPYEVTHLLLRHELEDLFDTTPDLSGADIDISRFIRSGDERDLHVFWEHIPRDTEPSSDLRPSREALCAVPFLAARDWLCGKETQQKKASRLKKGMRAWVWDWLDGRWRKVERRDLYPGQTVLVDAACGGYNPSTGWSPDHNDAVAPVDAAAEISPSETADASQDGEALSVYPWQTIATHGRLTGEQARQIAQELVPSLAPLFDLAGRWHDAGKSHPAFQASIVSENRPARFDLAKAPAEAWLPPSRLYPTEDGRRAGFRHEIASVLALFEVLKRHAPDHPALLGPWRELLESAGFSPETAAPSAEPPTPLEREVIALDAESFNLVAYLVSAHHGKVRMAWHASPADLEAQDAKPRIRGLCDGDLLPALKLAAADRSICTLPPTRIDLVPAAAGLNPRTGPGWTERVLGLLECYGPFALAWLESLMRAADQRASRLNLPDDELQKEG